MRKKKVNNLVFRYSDSLQREPKDSTERLLELIGELSIHNINGKIPLMYTNNSMTEKVEKLVPFTTATKKIQDLKINLIQYVKNLHNENYRTLRKEIEDTQIWKKKSFTLMN